MPGRGGLRAKALFFGGREVVVVGLLAREWEARPNVRGHWP